MASPTERRRNNLRVGIFVTFALALAMIVIVLLGDIAQYFKGSPNKYVVYFPVSQGVKNLKDGSEVLVGGLSMGKVQSVELAQRQSGTPDVDGGRTEEIRVAFSLDSAVTLHENPSISVQGPLIGAESWLQISNFGDMSAAVLPEGAEIDGGGGGSPFKDLLGIDIDLVRADLQSIIDNVKKITEDWAAFHDRVDPRIQEFITKADSVASDVKDSSAAFRRLALDVEQERWPGWTGKIDEILDSSRSATNRIDTFIVEHEDDASTIIADARVAGQEFKEVSESFNRTAKEVERITPQLEQTIEKFDALLIDGRDAVGLASDTLAGIKRDYPNWSLDIEETLANASLTAQQSKLAMIEIRDNPWKVLYTPSREEVENELLYDATRSFALAVADLKSASLAAERILNDHEEALQQDPATLERVKRNLIDPLERYEQAQSKLFEILKTK